MAITEKGLPQAALTTMSRNTKRAPGSLREVLGARELLANLVRRDLRVRHRGTFLGLLWSLATPLVTVGLYYFVFTIIFRTTPVSDLPRPDGNPVPFAVYFFSGLVLWNFFGTSVGSSTSSITGSGYLLNKVYFPRAVLPLSSVLSSLVTFGFEIAVLLVVSLAIVGLPSLHLLWVPVILLVVGTFAVGVSLLLSAATVFLRDVAHFVGLFLQVWFWATPVIYSLGFVSSRSGPGVIRLLELNPLTGAVISFRNVVVLNHQPDFSLLAYDAVVAIVTLAVGA
ncbi:MAG: ABC transporter permease, partial [Actinobacteria bacterium]|nr:ABC transporter permease [Actinomycetota bacterium]